MMQGYQHACRATQGARSYQEDVAAFLLAAEPDTSGRLMAPSLPRQMVAVLADGMGGHAGGRVAATLVCEGFIEALRGDAFAAPGPRQMLVALDLANDVVARKIAEEPMYTGMGSTMIGAAFGPDGLEFVSVGDSPLLLFRHGEVAQLNADHSLAPELDRLAEAGHLSRAQARRDPRRHMLRSAVTGDEIAMIDHSERPTALFPGDYVILASDGLQTLDNGEIARIIAGYAGDGPVAVAEALIREVENHRQPHQDNATVVAVQPIFQPA